MFSSLSPPEYANWTRWIKSRIKRIAAMDEPDTSRKTRCILRGIRQLKDMDIVIKQADKNLGIVPIRGNIYRALRSKHLNSTAFKKVDTFPHRDIYQRLRNILKLGCEISNLTKGDWLNHAIKAKEPCYFYVIPKLHKLKLSTRPITANHSYMLAPLSKQLAQVLQVKVNHFKEIAHDSKMVMQQINDLHLTQPIEFITYDVENMYPSINIKEAIKTLHDEIPEMRKNCGFWTKILQLIMYNNYVQAGNSIYRQEEGTATGTQVAPPFANLFLYYKFRRILRNPRILYSSRYIDDGLLIVTMNTSAKAIVYLLEKVSGHKLTYVSSPYEATYLDITLYKGERYFHLNKLDSKVYFKPTNKFLYLPSHSHHPSPHKKAVIKGESIRCLRICSNRANWLSALNLIFKGLMNRGYKPTIIKNEWRKVRYEDRDKYLTDSSTKERPNGVIVTNRYHPELKQDWSRLINLHPIRSSIFITRRLGQLNAKHRMILANWPPIIVFKDFTKIGNRVISAKEQLPTQVVPYASITRNSENEDESRQRKQ